MGTHRFLNSIGTAEFFVVLILVLAFLVKAAWTTVKRHRRQDASTDLYSQLGTIRALLQDTPAGTYVLKVEGAFNDMRISIVPEAQYEGGHAFWHKEPIYMDALEFKHRIYPVIMANSEMRVFLLNELLKDFNV